MRLLLILFMFFQIGCATKYILPGNRFMTPESQGGVLSSQFEFQQASANQLTSDLSNGSTADGVTYEVVTRSGYLFSTSLLDQMDIFWSHTGGGNSLLGVKYQVLGASRSGKGTGHKIALSAAFGGNEHETDVEPKVEFKLSGQEFQLLYGYRFDEMILVYSNFSYAKYAFTGEVSSTNPVLNGLMPEYETSMKSLLGGLELSYGPLFGKLELAYQQLKTTDSENKTHFIYGYSIGYSF